MRNKAIDILRGLGILTIIFIHVTAWYAHDKTAYFIWNWGQFAVPAFVFCSTYLFFIKKEKYEKEGFTNYSLSRLKRLLAPYYIWLIFFYLIYVIKNPASISLQHVLRSVTLTTPGNEVGWAVLLFVFLTILMVPLVGLWRKTRSLFIVYSLLAVGSAFLLMFFPWPFNYKLIMWLPWSLVILYSWFFAKFENQKSFFPLIILSTASLFISLWFLNDALGNSSEFIKNKYPPNLYYLSYGMLATTLIYYLAKRGVFDSIHKPIHFLSVNSYNIFFVHLFLVIAFSEFMNIQRLAWWMFFLLICTFTFIIQYIIGVVRRI